MPAKLVPTAQVLSRPALSWASVMKSSMRKPPVTSNSSKSELPSGFMLVMLTAPMETSMDS